LNAHHVCEWPIDDARLQQRVVGELRRSSGSSPASPRALAGVVTIEEAFCDRSAPHDAALPASRAETKQTASALEGRGDRFTPMRLKPFWRGARPDDET